MEDRAVPFRTRLPLVAGLTAGLALLVAFMLASVVYGAADIGPATAYRAFMAFDGSTEHLIVRTVRAPRALIAASVGASLGVAGAVMQALTRNPLASPGILGINAGAALGVVLAVFLLRVPSLDLYAVFAFAGAGLAAVVVYLLGSGGRGGLTPLKLTVAGAAVTAFLASVTQGLLVVNERTLDELRFWLAGSVAGRDVHLLLHAAPYMAAGMLCAVLLGRQITIFSMGEDIARSLGQRTGWVKALAAAAVVVLAGSAVAVAGPVGFIGLAVPHFARGMVGNDYRWVLPYAAVLGGILLLLADIGARTVIRPEEVPVGVMTALLGAPFFIYLARRGVRKA